MILNVFGPSGSGKTTLIKSLLKLNNLQSFYKSFFNEYQIKKNKSFTCSISLVPLPTFRGRIKDFLEIYGIKLDVFFHLKPELKKLLNTIINIENENDLLNFGNRNLETLSAGEMRRFFILKSLLNNVDMVVIDEPFSNSDKLLFNIIFDSIKEFKNSIILSHLSLEGKFKNYSSINYVNVKNL